MDKGNGWIYVVTTLDTKGVEALFVRDLIARQGLNVRVVDLSTRDAQAEHGADISAGCVADYHPQGRQAVFCGDRGKAITAMASAFSHFMAARGDACALLGLGGSGGTALITPAMQQLPLGVPKLMVSTMACGDVSGYIGASDIAIMYSVTDVAGLNRISRKILANAANQIAGAVKFHSVDDDAADAPAVALTMFGVTTPCIQSASELLNSRFDCLVFHATGSGGKAMEKLISQRLVAGCLDITTTEVCDYLFGGVLACDERRFDAIIDTGTPCVMSCGALDMINFGAPATVPARYQDRLFYHHNPQVTLMRTTPAENRALAEWIAAKLNQCEGEVRFVIPQKGFSALDCEGGPFRDPEATRAFIDTLEARVVQTDKRRIVKTDDHINDGAFARRLVDEFLNIID
ncbi:Tm-1-like ATP-binding domain-containing protein [Entomohabitans teleogrylli]|uniref:Tm-1-like ATP-binding domain-containing protein n=1 Tax=Entomohabitans teleogrylli TaxID=1384589 RepID=UPI00073DA28A|nr:Tm-1-like ATP-binding domain-containing protein [Entomohabitans teleogrylli]